MSPLTLALIAWFVVVVVTLRVTAIARDADEQADLQWEELGLLRSASGTAFFPTRTSRPELARAIHDVIAMTR